MAGPSCSRIYAAHGYLGLPRVLHKHGSGARPLTRAAPLPCTGQFNATHGSVWRGTVGGLARVAVLSSAAAALAGALVLPSLAADEMRADAGAAVRAIGHAASRCVCSKQGQVRMCPHGNSRAGLPRCHFIDSTASNGGATQVQYDSSLRTGGVLATADAR